MNTNRKLVVIISNGMDNERSSVAWSITNAGVKSGLDVSVFLVSAGVDWARKRAATMARPNPEDPSIGEMIQAVIDSGTPVGACPPCSKVRGYTEADFIHGVKIVGPDAVHGPIKEGAAVLNF